MDIPIQPLDPAEKVQQIPARGPDESEDVARGKGFGLLAGVGFDAPAKVFAAPGGEPVAAGGVPEKAESGEQLAFLALSIAVQRRAQPVESVLCEEHRCAGVALSIGLTGDHMVGRP